MSTFVDEVAAALGSLPAEERRAVLDDLRAALADGASPEDLGSPQEYAAAVRDAYAADDGPAEDTTVFGVPWETRGPTDAGVRSRIWAPEDPRLLVPRMFGLGWTVNLGAVAVRLGLIRPEDWDDESLDAVDPRLLQALRWAPLAYALAAVVIAARTTTSGRPVPTHWGPQGLPDQWATSSTAALLPAAAAVGFAAWGAQPTAGDDRMLRPALGAAGAGLGCAIAALTESTSHHPERGSGPVWLLALAAAVLPAHVAVPVAAALRARRSRR